MVVVAFRKKESEIESTVVMIMTTLAVRLLLLLSLLQLHIQVVQMTRLLYIFSSDSLMVVLFVRCICEGILHLIQVFEPSLHSHNTAAVLRQVYVLSNFSREHVFIIKLLPLNNAKYINTSVYLYVCSYKK